jgi:uncharacterized protein (DUF1501 family)
VGRAARGGGGDGAGTACPAAGGADRAGYPDTKLASQLKLVSGLIRSRAATRVYYAAQSGYDTHVGQTEQHALLLRELFAALKAFLDDLKSAKLSDRVVVMAFSEFGRRVAENSAEGTDHGTAGPVFIAGDTVRPGLIGKTPDLNDLDEGDLKATADFRQVYAEILNGWLKLPTAAAPGDAFPALNVLRAV